MKDQPTHRAEDSRIATMLADTWFQSRGTVSLAILCLCVGLFIGVTVLDRVGFPSRQSCIAVLGLSYVGVFRHFWWYQFLTAPLLHANVTHLLFNMLSLWMLGPSVEKILGRRRYVLFSLLCAECSMIGFLLFNWGTGNIVLGYSGVIFGILVAQAVFFPDNVIAVFAFFPLRMKYAVLLLGAVELYLTISPEQGGIAHAAHLFGAISALIYLRGISWAHSAWTAASRLISHLPRRIRGHMNGSRIMTSMDKKRSVKPSGAAQPRPAPPKDIPWEL